MKRAKSFKEILAEIPPAALNYIKSLLFMAFLVGLNRAGLCINWFKNQTYLMDESTPGFI